MPYSERSSIIPVSVFGTQFTSDSNHIHKKKNLTLAVDRRVDSPIKLHIICVCKYDCSSGEKIRFFKSAAL